MLLHFVKITVTDETSDDDRDHIVASLRAMFDASPEVHFYRIEPGVRQERSMLVVSGFDDLEAMQRYFEEPLHKTARLLIAKHRATPEPNVIDVIIDKEFEDLLR